MSHVVCRKVAFGHFREEEKNDWRGRGGVTPPLVESLPCYLVIIPVMVPQTK